MKAVKYVAALFLMLIFAIVLGQIHPNRDRPLTNSSQATIWVLSDTHFLSLIHI